MPCTFLSAYLQEVTSSLSNWHQDNYDFYRFGPQPKDRPQRSWRTPIIEFLRGRGYVSSSHMSDSVSAAVRLIETNVTHYEWLFKHLADDESRDILVKVLAFRALGHHRVKLPLNTPSYWATLKHLVSLANPSEYIPLSFHNWQLHLMDLNAIDLPILLYYIPFGTCCAFILEQYHCKSHGVDIAVEPGDYVIDAGACYGDTALYFAYRSKPDGRVYSYEFVPDNLKILQRNLALNPELRNRIQVVENAAWDVSDVRLAIQGEGPGSSVGVADSSVKGIGPLTLTIDDLVQRQNLPKVDFIKMDIEGSELAALRGAKQTIQRYKPKLAISVYHRLNDIYEVPQFLDSLGCGYCYYLRHFTIHAEETVLFAVANRQ